MGRYPVFGLALLSLVGCAKRSDDQTSSRVAVASPRTEPAPVRQPDQASRSGRDALAPADDGPEPSRASARAQGGNPLLPPLRAEGDVIELQVPGFENAYVSVPTLATGPRPVLVAAHGAGDRHDRQCNAWRDIVDDRAFVLCPAGHPMQGAEESRGFVWSDASSIGREVDAGLDALEGRFIGYVQRQSPVYAGFSQGAILGVPLLARRSADFPRIVLIEGGWGGWQTSTARSFGKSGGERVLFVCGQKACMQGARHSSKALEAAGVETRIAGVEDAGHTYGGVVHESLRESWPWVVQGLPGWQ